jgi:uncharacterized protein involved in outer membrane biogenesis
MSQAEIPAPKRPWYAKRRFLLTGVLLLAALAAVLILGGAILRGPVAGILSAELDRDVSIDGLLTLGWSGGPTLAATDITIAGNEGAEPALEAGRIDVGVAYDALIEGRFVVTRFDASDAVLRPDGFATVDAEDAAPSAPLTADDFAIFSDAITVSLDNVRIDTSSGANDLLIDHLLLVSTAGEDTVITGTLELGGRSFDLSYQGAAIRGMAGRGAVPVNLVITDGETSIAAEGTLQDLLSDPVAQLTFDGHGSDLASLLETFDVDTDLQGSFELSASVSLEKGVLALDRLVVAAEGFRASGGLKADLAAAPVAISGRMALSGLPTETDESAAQEGIPEIGDLLDFTLPFEALHQFDLDVIVDLGHVDLGPVALDDISLPVRLTDGRLEISPIDVALEGQDFVAHVRAGGDSDAVSVELIGHTMPLTDLLTRLRPDLALEGEASGMVFSAKGEGATVRKLLATLTLDLKLARFALSNTYQDGQTVSLEIDDLSATAGADEGLRVSAGGILDGADAGISLAAGPLRDLIDDEKPWPIEFHLGSGERKLEFAGVLADPENFSGLHMEGVIKANDVQHVAELLDLNLPVKGDADAYIHVSSLENGIRFDWIDLKLGNSEINGNLDIAYIGGEISITGALVAPNIKVDTGRSDGETKLDEPLIEHGDLEGVHADITLSLDRIKAATVRLRNVEAQLLIDDGVLTIAGAKAVVFETTADVDIRVDTDAAPPVLTFSVATGAVDPAHIGNDMGLQGFMTGSISSIAVSATSRGVTLRDLANAADVSIAIKDGDLKIGSGETALEFVSLRLAAKPGERAHGSESIVLGGIPIDLDLTFVTLADLFTKPSPWTLVAQGSLLELNFAVSREITPSLEIYAQPVTMKMESDDLRVALAELDIDLPHPLPLATHGTLQVLDDRVAFDLTEAQLANTDVSGKLDVWLEGEPQRVEADFDSRLVSINDFIEDTPEEDVEEFDVDRFLADPIPAWEVPDIALRVALDADAIHWDDVVISDATSTITTANGTLHLDQMSALVFGGRVMGSLALTPQGDATHADANLDVRQIDADDVFRLTGIAEEAEGELELVADFKAGGVSPAALLATLDGSVLLERGKGWIRSGAIEILNEDLFTALLTPSGRIPVRCTVIDLTFSKGSGAFDDSFISLDQVVLGVLGSLDLASMTVDAQVVPKSLTGTFMRLLTPVSVSGDLFDPSISPSAGDVITGIGAALFGAGPTYDGDIDAKCAAAQG